MTTAKSQPPMSAEQLQGARLPTEVIGHPGDFPGFLFWRASLRWQRAMTAALRPFELTHVQWIVLVGAWLMELEYGPPSQRELAEHQGMDVMMTGQVLTGLEKRGFVTRRRDDADKRVRRVSVTPAGAELGRKAFGTLAEADAAFFAQIDDPDSLIEPLRTLAGWEE